MPRYFHCGGRGGAVKARVTVKASVRIALASSGFAGYRATTPDSWLHLVSRWERPRHGAVAAIPERMPIAMKNLGYLLLLVIPVWLLVAGQPLRADCRETAILENANAVLTELAAIPCKKIPPA